MAIKNFRFKNLSNIRVWHEGAIQFARVYDMAPGGKTRVSIRRHIVENRFSEEIDSEELFKKYMEATERIWQYPAPTAPSLGEIAGAAEEGV